MEQREKQQKKIEFLRKIHSKNERESTLQLNQLKMKVAKNLLAAYKKGKIFNIERF